MSSGGLLRSTRRTCLKHIFGVRAAPSLRPEDLVGSVLETDMITANAPSSQKFLYEGHRPPNGKGALSGTSAKHQTVQLRIGGAQMLVSTRNSIHNHNLGHPLYFSKTSPKAAGLSAHLVDALRTLRIRHLTELQGALIPLVLKGKHVIAHAETGTGKSFGVALAVANRIIRDQINYRLHTIIVCPTDELALQYDKWLKHFGGCASQIVQPAVESIPLQAQLARLHNIQPHVLVGTPQRLADITRLSPTILGEKLRRKVDTIILDEADMILQSRVMYGRVSISGADLVDRIYRSTTEEVPAQLVAMSATVDGSTAQLLNGWMRNDRAVRITTSFVEHTIPHTIVFYFFASSPRFPLKECLIQCLRLIFKQHRKPRVLVFTSFEVGDVVKEIAEATMPELQCAGEPSQGLRHPCSSRVGPLQESVDPLNPNKHVKAKQLVQRDRDVFVRNDSNISRLNEGLLSIGVGRYELSRGIHVTGVTHVVIYGEVPPSAQFVHCAGRTGRMGRPGEVLTIFNPSCGRTVQTVCRSLEIPMQMNRMENVQALLERSEDGGINDKSCTSGEDDPEEQAVRQLDEDGRARFLSRGDLDIQQKQRQLHLAVHGSTFQDP
jgi:superfamily II DNA/RNA helicase